MSHPEPSRPSSEPTPSVHAGTPGPRPAGATVRPVPGPSPAVPRPPTALATASIVVACVWTALVAVSFVSSFSASAALGAALDEMAATGGGGMLEVTTHDRVARWLLGAQVVAFVVTCLWLHQSRRLAVTLSPFVPQARGPVWVWLGWVVPVVSLWFPYQVVRDVRSATAGSVRRGGLGLWWGCWLGSLWLMNQATFATMGYGPRDPALLPGIEGLSLLVMVVALVLWVRLVREVTADQRARTAPARS